MDFFQKKESFFCFVVLSIVSISLQAEQSKFIFGRLHFPSQEEIKTEISASKKRRIEKNLVSLAAVAGTITTLYGLACIRNIAQKEKDFITVKRVQNSSDVSEIINKKDSSLSNYFININDFFYDFSKFLADTGTMFAAGFVSSCAYDFILKKIKNLYHSETLLWFIGNQTNLKDIFADLKRRAIYYDLNSSLLSSEMYNLEKEVHLQAFIEEISQNLLISKNNGTLVGVDYYKSLLKALEKKYKKEFFSLQELDEYILPILSAQKRNILKSGKTDLFNRDNQARIDIAFLCDLFIKEFTKLLLFIKTHKNNQILKVVDLIETGNQFLDHMESMLNMSKDELNILSKNNQGMFTVVYEFEKFLEDQISFLDKYVQFN